ncbi:MAG: PRC-barrel domain-containing protein [Longimicrobiales bacterium]
MALRPLSRLTKFSFAPGTFDVRAFEVRTLADDEDVGTVDDVLVDENGNARYMDIDVGVFRKHVLLPVGQARVDADDDIVWVTGMTRAQLKDIPEWHHDTDLLDVGYESRLGRAYSDTYRDDRYYDRPEYNATWWHGTEREPPASADVGTRRARLRRLSELDDYEVADDDPDPRGWDVQSADGRSIGRVDELIVEPAAMKARYLDVELDASALELDGNRHVLIPVGFAELDPDDDRVKLNTVRSSDLATLPAHTGAIERSYEDTLNERYAGGLTSENRYAHPMYRVDIFYGARTLPGTETPRDPRAGRDTRGTDRPR